MKSFTLAPLVGTASFFRLEEAQQSIELAQQDEALRVVRSPAAA